MIFLAKNLKLLRAEQGISQQVLADKLHISRASLAKYESLVNEPSLDLLIRISRYFRISIDMLLTIDISKYQNQFNRKASFDNTLIFPIQVDANGDNMIEVVPHHAQAGYQGNYSDPGFIESLDQMALPFQEIHGKCRAFPIDGDSMPPFASGSYVIGRQIVDSSDIKNGCRYVFLSRDEGIVFKRAYRQSQDSPTVHLHSDNPKYQAFEMSMNEIIEVWEFVGAISFQKSSENYFKQEVVSKMHELREEVTKLASAITTI